MTPAIERKIKELEKLTELYKLDEDITVYRGLPAEYLSEPQAGKKRLYSYN
jgi:hypothetical protein